MARFSGEGALAIEFKELCCLLDGLVKNHALPFDGVYTSRFCGCPKLVGGHVRGEELAVSLISMGR